MSRTRTWHRSVLRRTPYGKSINRLLNIYVSQDIDRESFLTQKGVLLSKKKALEEALELDEREGYRRWLEPFKQWVRTAQTLSNIAQAGAPEEKRRAAVQVFGSNLFLDSRKARGCAVEPWSHLSDFNQTGGMVGWEGLEPSTNGLKGRCSTD